jgi:hypothetical protein
MPVRTCGACLSKFVVCCSLAQYPFFNVAAQHDTALLSPYWAWVGADGGQCTPGRAEDGDDSCLIKCSTDSLCAAALQLGGTCAPLSLSLVREEESSGGNGHGERLYMELLCRAEQGGVCISCPDGDSQPFPSVPAVGSAAAVRCQVPAVPLQSPLAELCAATGLAMVLGRPVEETDQVCERLCTGLEQAAAIIAAPVPAPAAAATTAAAATDGTPKPPSVEERSQEYRERHPAGHGVVVEATIGWQLLIAARAEGRLGSRAATAGMLHCTARC